MQLEGTKGSACYGASESRLPTQGMPLEAHNLDYFKLVTMTRRHVHPLDLSLLDSFWVVNFAGLLQSVRGLVSSSLSLPTVSTVGAVTVVAASDVFGLGFLGRLLVSS